MNDRIKERMKTTVNIGITFLLILAQGVLFIILGENKSSEVLFMLLCLVGCSEVRLYFQKLALFQEEQFHEQKQKEAEEETRQAAIGTVKTLQALAEQKL
jgi:hypothetical protein